MSRITEVLERLTDNRKTEHLRVKPPTPTLTAKDAVTLKQELRAIQIYCNDAQQTTPRDWLHVARTVASGRAKVSLDSFLLQAAGGNEGYQALRAQPSFTEWPQLWDGFISRLKYEVGLDTQNEAIDAHRLFTRLRLQPSAGPAEMERFMTEYTYARTLLIETGRINPSDPTGQKMEVETLLDKCTGHPFCQFLAEKGEEVTGVDHVDPALAKGTFFGWMRVFVRSRRGAGLTGKTNAPETDKRPNNWDNRHEPFPRYHYQNTSKLLLKQLQRL